MLNLQNVSSSCDPNLRPDAMPRPPRLIVPGQPLHLTQRGNNRGPMFVTDNDYSWFLDLVGEASRKTRCAVHAYVLMTNHVHLLVTPSDLRGPARMMQAIGQRYVRVFNRLYGRTGTLWEGRYRSALIDSGQYFLACSRYIELNPIRIALTGHPMDFRWSSHRHNASGSPDPVIEHHPIYSALGSSPGERQSAYRALFRSHLDETTVERIRQATRNRDFLAEERIRSEPPHLVAHWLERPTHVDRVGASPPVPAV